MPRHAYVTHAYYSCEYFGRKIDVEDFPRIALRASDEIDRITFGRIRRAGFESFPSDAQEAVKQATCTVAEALYTVDFSTDGGVVTTSESASGAYSYSVDAASVKGILPEALAAAKSLLIGTGLLYAGGGGRC